MKKGFTLLLILSIIMTIFGCSTKEKEVEQNKDDSQINEEISIDVDIWDIEPIYEFDDIDNWFTTRYAQTAGVDYAGAESSLLLSFFIMYNREDFYNENGKYKFVIEKCERGAIKTCKNGLYGIIRANGKTVFEPTLSYYTRQAQGIIYIDYGRDKEYGYFLNQDYSIEKEFEVGTVGFAGGSDSKAATFISKDGKCVSYYNSYYGDKIKEEEFDLFKYAVANDMIDEDDYMLVNTFASFYDCKNNNIYVESLDNSIDGYIVLSNNKYKVLPIGSNYVAVDFSNGILMFGKCDKSLYELNKAINLSQYYYSFELCCDSYSYSDFTYVNTNGEIIASGYDDGYGFYEECAPVKKNGKWGYIDKQGNVVIDYIFDKATPLCDGKAWVIYQGKTGRLNIKDMLDNNIPFNEYTLSIKNDFNEKQ